MDDLDRDNLLVFSIFGGSVFAAVVGYLLAWRSNRTAFRKAGSLMTAAVVGLAGLLMLAWIVGAIMPLPPPNGESLWAPLIILLVLSPLPLGAFYFSARLIRRALRDEEASPADKAQNA